MECIAGTGRYQRPGPLALVLWPASHRSIPDEYVQTFRDRETSLHKWTLTKALIQLFNVVDVGVSSDKAW